jgi:hypothetical protein
VRTSQRIGPSSNTYVLFVVILTPDDSGDDSIHTFKADARVGSTVTEASKFTSIL